LEGVKRGKTYAHDDHFYLMAPTSTDESQQANSRRGRIARGLRASMFGQDERNPAPQNFR
jgi:hypothetical protein